MPEGFDWDMWLGPAPERPFNKRLLAVCRGAAGTISAAAHSAIWAVTASRGCSRFWTSRRPLRWKPARAKSYEETYPKASIVHLNYPGRDNRPPVHMAWYDGGLRPPRPAGHRQRGRALFPEGRLQRGHLYVGDKGCILAGFNGDQSAGVSGESQVSAAGPPPAWRRRQRRGHGGPPRDPAIDQWIAACKGAGRPRWPTSRFSAR